MKMSHNIIIAPENPSQFALNVPVLKIFDGDGFLTRIRRGEISSDLFDKDEIEVTARFGFVDAPEMEQPGGREAKDFLASLIGGRRFG